MNHRITKLIIILSLTVFLGVSARPSAKTDADPQTRSKKQKRKAPSSNPEQRADYSSFTHRVPDHRKQACSACHKFPSANWKEVRKAEDAFPDITDYPEHASCLPCHRKQFFTGARPAICFICHTNPSPRDSSRHPFPNPEEIFDQAKTAESFTSEYGISFPHDKHIEIVGQNPVDRPTRLSSPFILASFVRKARPGYEESQSASCAVCHKTYMPQGDSDDEYVTAPPKDLAEDAFWLKKGTFKTPPSGHTICFTCHSEDSGLTPGPGDCNVCHNLLPPDKQTDLTSAHGDFDPKLAAMMKVQDRTALKLWSRRETAKFRHEWLPHADLDCAACHNASALNTLDKSTRVEVKSCGGAGTGCHIEATLEGALNFEVAQKKANAAFECTKCHIRNGQKPIPESHLSAIQINQTK